MSEVEIIWPSTLAESRLSGVAEELESGGVTTTCRIQPVRRGPETAVLILMTSSVLEPMLKTLFAKVGEEAFPALKRFIGRLFGDEPDKDADGEPAADEGEGEKDQPDVVIFESSATGAQFLFTANLPDEALRKALELDPETEPGRWMWDESAHDWLRFEDANR